MPSALSGQAADAIGVWAVQLPGRAGRYREPPIAAVRAIVDAVVPAPLPELDRPYALFGHSMGGVMAFEIARAMQARGAPTPAHLLVSARRAPHLHGHEADIHTLDDDAFVAEVNRRYGSIPPELLSQPDVTELLLPALRADMVAIETHIHTPGEPLTCPISSFGGDADPFTSPSELQAWQQHARLPIRTRLFTGGHFYFNEPPVLAELIAEVRSTLQPLVSALDADSSARSALVDPHARDLHARPGESFSRPSWPPSVLVSVSRAVVIVVREIESGRLKLRNRLQTDLGRPVAATAAFGWPPATHLSSLFDAATPASDDASREELRL